MPDVALAQPVYEGVNKPDTSGTAGPPWMEWLQRIKALQDDAAWADAVAFAERVLALATARAAEHTARRERVLAIVRGLSAQFSDTLGYLGLQYPGEAYFAELPHSHLADAEATLDDLATALAGIEELRRALGTSFEEDRRRQEAIGQSRARAAAACDRLNSVAAADSPAISPASDTLADDALESAADHGDLSNLPRLPMPTHENGGAADITETPEASGDGELTVGLETLADPVELTSGEQAGSSLSGAAPDGLAIAASESRPEGDAPTAAQASESDAAVPLPQPQAAEQPTDPADAIRPVTDDAELLPVAPVGDGPTEAQIADIATPAADPATDAVSRLRAALADSNRRDNSTDVLPTLAMLQRTWLSTGWNLRGFAAAQYAEQLAGSSATKRADLVPSAWCWVAAMLSDTGAARVQFRVDEIVNHCYEFPNLSAEHQHFVIHWTAAALLGAEAPRAMDLLQYLGTMLPTERHETGAFYTLCLDHLLRPGHQGKRPRLEVSNSPVTLRRERDEEFRKAEQIVNRAANYENAFVIRYWNRLVGAGGPVRGLLDQVRVGAAEVPTPDALAEMITGWEEIRAQYRNNILNRLSDFVVHLSRAVALEHRSSAADAEIPLDLDRVRAAALDGEAILSRLRESHDVGAAGCAAVVARLRAISNLVSPQ